MEKPILFNTEMVRAIHADRKSVTRRVIKGAQTDFEFFCMTNGEFLQNDPKVLHASPVWYVQFATKDKLNPWFFAKAPCRPGDVLWVRETWKQAMVDRAGGGYALEDVYLYKAGMHEDTTGMLVEGYWHPSIHMPRAAARIFLRVMDVRVERLQNIDEKQAKTEGARSNYGLVRDPENEYLEPLHTAREDFVKIWDSTIKPRDLPLYGWDANPWVWVIEFERTNKGIR